MIFVKSLFLRIRFSLAKFERVSGTDGFLIVVIYNTVPCTFAVPAQFLRAFFSIKYLMSRECAGLIL